MAIAAWLATYDRKKCTRDLTAAVIVTALLVPQSLAYAMLAGLPPHIGLISSIVPLIVYALLGSSSTLSVGPVALVSLLTASAVHEVVALGLATYMSACITLTFLVGCISLLMGALRMGALTKFISHTVLSGFITASALLIIFSQLKSLVGLTAPMQSIFDLMLLARHPLANINMTVLTLGLCALGFLLLSRRFGPQVLTHLRLSAGAAALLIRLMPVCVVILSICCAYFFNLENQQVALVGQVTFGLPEFNYQFPSVAVLKALFMPAALIAIVGFVESVSVAKTLGAKRREKIQDNQELIALGASNVATAVAGGFPVAGGVSRSVVNYDADAATQASGLFTALGILLVGYFLAPMLYFLPKAVLAAIIIVAVISVVDLSVFKKTWRFSKQDFVAVLVTVLVTLVLGVQTGLGCGILVSLVLYLYRSSQAHIAEVGLVEGTQHFRNVQRYVVQTHPRLLMIRPDENLFFANSALLEDVIFQKLIHKREVKHVVIQCSAINDIDFSALEVLSVLNQLLLEQGILLHLSEIKGPVEDKLKKSDFFDALSGQVFLHQYAAFQTLTLGS